MRNVIKIGRGGENGKEEGRVGKGSKKKKKKRGREGEGEEKERVIKQNEAYNNFIQN